MKNLKITVIALFYGVSTMAQVHIRPVPEPGYQQRIINYIGDMQVADTHEHLLNPAGFDSSMLDFMLLFRHYATGDFESAGMPRSILDNLFTDSLKVVEKWKVLKPWWDQCFNTGYNRAALLAAERLFQVKTIDETTVEEISAGIRKAYQGDWYHEVLKQKCNIDFVVEDYPEEDWENRIFGDPEMFRYVKKFDEFVLIDSKSGIDKLDRWNTGGIHSLDDLVSALGKSFHDAVSQGIVAAKSILAYNRTLDYEPVKKEDAQKVFQAIMNLPDGQALSFAEAKPMQDYMMRRVLDQADRYDLPIQIHTGLNGGDIENSKPTHLINLIREYPNVEFILFHGGYPYGGELAVLAKKFRNVYIDLCWLYIISPSYSERYLKEWLETVPANKIMAFGGDFLYVEGVYSHLALARDAVSKVLTEQVRDGYFSEEEAIKVAQMIFHDNAVRILKLKKP